MGRLQDKNCIVTGAGRGIGRAIARKFLEEGAHVVACDLVFPDEMRELAELGPLKMLMGDVSDAAFCQSLIAATGAWGELDVLMNNAGIAVFEPFLEHSLEAWQRTQKVNLEATFTLAQKAARLLVAQGKGGAIINMASTNGHRGEAGLAAYNASKSGVVSLTQTMAVELGAHNIRVNCVAPGHIETTLAREGGADEKHINEYLRKIPLGRAGQPDEVASLCAFLASDEAAFISGTSVVIDGGQTAGQ